MNVARALERAARHFPDKPAILFEDRRLGYRELDCAASRTARALAIRGVGPGDRVALLLPNIPAFAVAYQAVQKLGAIAVSANAMLTTEELAVLLEDSGAGVVFTVEAFWPLRFVPAPRRVVLGLVSTKTPALESADALKRRIDEDAHYVPLERLGLSPQCGFSSAPGSGQPITPDDQRRKLELVLSVARDVWGTD